VATPVAGLIAAGAPQVEVGGTLPPSVNVYVPVGFTPTAFEVTVAVSVTVWPSAAGFGVAASAVVVASRNEVNELVPVLATVLASPL
jgi:hypothetical protein